MVYIFWKIKIFLDFFGKIFGFIYEDVLYLIVISLFNKVISLFKMI